MIDGEVVSSTVIRQALSSGDVKKVTRLLGRPFVLHGRIVHGDERGKELGFPTANLTFSRGQALPEDGVYVTKAYLGGQPHPSVTNIGKRPTFGENRRTVEVYLIGFSGEIYGENLRIELVDRLRDEKRFSSSGGTEGPDRPGCGKGDVDVEAGGTVTGKVAGLAAEAGGGGGHHRAGDGEAPGIRQAAAAEAGLRSQPPRHTPGACRRAEETAPVPGDGPPGDSHCRRLDGSDRRSQRPVDHPPHADGRGSQAQRRELYAAVLQGGGQEQDSRSGCRASGSASSHWPISSS